MWELKIPPGNISIWSTETLESTTHTKGKQQTDPKWQMHDRSFRKHTTNENKEDGEEVHVLEYMFIHPEKPPHFCFTFPSEQR